MKKPKGNTDIESIGIYLPSKQVSTLQIINECVHPINVALERLAGIDSRRMVEDGEYSLELAIKAIDQCFANSKYEPADIDLLICCNISRFEKGDKFTFEPSTSNNLAEMVGLQHATSFDINNACAGVFTGIQIADAYLQLGMAERVMVVSGEYLTHLTKTAQKEIIDLQDSRLACLTLGDSGTAMILETGHDTQTGFHTIDLLTLGDYSKYCIAVPTDKDHRGCIMYTQSIKLAKVAIKGSSECFKEILEKHCWNPRQVDHLIPHQTSISTISMGLIDLNNLLGERIFQQDKNVIVNLIDKGNTSTNSHIIAFYENLENGRIKKGDKVVFSIQASGVTLGTALYTVNGLAKDNSNVSLNGKTKTQTIHNNNITSHSEQTQRIKISSIGIAPFFETEKNKSLEFAKRATENCFEKINFNKQDLDLLIFSGIYRQDFICEPAIGAMIAGELNINGSLEKNRQKNSFAFDLTNGPVGSLNALQLASSMINSGKVTNTLVVASEVENNKGGPHQLLGIEETGAAIFLESSNDQSGFGFFYFKKFPQWQDASDIAGTWDDNSLPYLEIQQSEHLESFYLSAIKKTVNELLEKNNLTLSDFNFILPPQISTSFIEALKIKLNLSSQRIIDVTPGKKDLYSSSIHYSFDYIFKNKMEKEGDKALIICVGSGIQVGCAVYHF